MLRRFSPDAGRSHVIVFGKTTGRTWAGGMATTASGKGYNTLTDADGGRLNFEPDFDEIDRAYARIGDQLAASRDASKLDLATRWALADVVAVQLLRTPIVRSTLGDRSADDVTETWTDAGVGSRHDLDLGRARCIGQGPR